MFHITETGKEQDTMFVMESTVIWSINISSLDTTGKEEEKDNGTSKGFIGSCFKESRVEQGRGRGNYRALHFIGHQFFLVNHTIGECVLAFI